MPTQLYVEFQVQKPTAKETEQHETSGRIVLTALATIKHKQGRRMKIDAGAVTNHTMERKRMERKGQFGETFSSGHASNPRASEADGIDSAMTFPALEPETEATRLDLSCVACKIDQEEVRQWQPLPQRRRYSDVDRRAQAQDVQACTQGKLMMLLSDCMLQALPLRRRCWALQKPAW